MANKVDYFETTPDDAGTVFNANWEAQTLGQHGLVLQVIGIFKYMEQENQDLLN